MNFTPEDILKKTIYLDDGVALAKRIDYAWHIYTSDNDLKKYDEKKARKIKKEALSFLMYALNVGDNDLNTINATLLSLITERQAHTANCPNYIPGKLPSRLPFDPRETPVKRTSVSKKSNNPLIQEAFNTQELLDVKDQDKSRDKTKKTRFFSSEEQAKNRVVISHGLFKQNGVVFSTTSMISHKKPGFAAFTLNALGELIIHNHFGMVDRIAHSSANAGAPVVAAGELKIVNGQLQAITTHSGHYKPSLFNMYRFLEYCEQQGASIRQTSVLTFRDPSTYLKHLKAEKTVEYMDIYSRPIYKTSAQDFYVTLRDLVDQNIAFVEKSILSYQSNNLLNLFFWIKDFLTSSNFTAQRMSLASEFLHQITGVNKELDDKLTEEELQEKIGRLKTMNDDMLKKNQDLSLKAGKERNNGRFTCQLSLFARQLTENIPPETLSISQFLQ